MTTIRRKYAKLERNSICPCEENDKREKPLKYKQCCLKEIQNSEQQIRMLHHHDRRVAKAKKKMDAAIERDKQYGIDHPILLPDGAVLAPNDNKIIIP